MKESFFNEQHLPLVIEPNGTGRAKEDVLNYIRHNKAAFDQKFHQYGAVLFRGFDVAAPAEFEEICMQVDNRMESGYYGTSPRRPVAGTRFVYTASELPSYYPIMQHCEMSYVVHPPVNLFFYGYRAPDYGGETPLCNFRKVYTELHPEIRKEFDQKGVMTVRNYSGLGKASSFNLFELKKWNEIFLTEDKSEVERQCREQQIEFEWLANDQLRLIHRTPAAMAHPLSGEQVWFNHLQVFHPFAASVEYRYIHQRQRRWKTWFWKNFIGLMVKIKERRNTPMAQSMNVLFGDGQPIPNSYVEHVEEVIWKNLVIYPWQKNDVLAIDNFSTSHGRLPYEGERNILVCWSV